MSTCLRQQTDGGLKQPQCCFPVLTNAGWIRQWKQNEDEAERLVVITGDVFELWQPTAALLHFFCSSCKQSSPSHFPAVPWNSAHPAAENPGASAL